jgi:predicted nucleic acid-binding protein
MNGRIFIDTNVLVYSHDQDAGSKREIPLTVMQELWEQEIGVISTQVLQEFYVTVTRKIPNPLSPATARGIIENYLFWHVELNDSDTILSASEIGERHMISFWDSLIIAAAKNARADRILTEDLNHGQMIESILIENPFLEAQKH